MRRCERLPLYVDHLNFQRMPPDALTVGMTAAVKIRYAAPPASAVIAEILDDRIVVQFETPQRAVTPGQSAVFYDADSRGDVLFGGRIVT